MRIPRSFELWLRQNKGSCGATVQAGGRRYSLYASIGIRYVVIRSTDKERPWLCDRIVGKTDSWRRGDYSEREDYIMAFLRRLQRPAQGSLDRPDPVDSELAGKFPALHEYLTRSRDDEGKARQTASLTVYGHAGAFKGFLNDRDSGGSLGVQSDSLAGLLRALEAELESDAPSWFWRQGGEGHPAKNRKGRT